MVAKAHGYRVLREVCYHAVHGFCTENMFTTDVLSEILTTAAPAHHPWPMYWGFVAIAVASILFGSNLIPIKKFETGDGA